jgi:hypothetical protein
MSATNGVSCSQFFHRVNSNKTMDAICLVCFLTAATSDNEADLHELELAHQCGESPLSLLSAS